MKDWLEIVSKQPPALPALNPGQFGGSPLAEAYFRYYGIDFENRYAGLEHFFGTFDSAGFQIATHVFRLPDATATAFIYHGYYDHSGLYRHIIAYALSRGLSVVIYDLPGHGLSTGERATIDDFSCYVEVLRAALTAVAPFNLPEPRHAFAQSTGCSVLMTHLLTGGDDDFDKVVLLAPLVRPTGGGVGRYVHSVLSRFTDSLKRGWVLNSHDETFFHFLRHEDPLQSRDLPMQWVGAWKAWERYFEGLPPSQRSLLLVQGRKDNTVNWRYNVASVCRHFPSAQVHYIANARHQLVNEREDIRAQVWQRIDDYLELLSVSPEAGPKVHKHAAAKP